MMDAVVRVLVRDERNGKGRNALGRRCGDTGRVAAVHGVYTPAGTVHAEETHDQQCSEYDELQPVLAAAGFRSRALHSHSIPRWRITSKRWVHSRASPTHLAGIPYMGIWFTRWYPPGVPK